MSKVWMLTDGEYSDYHVIGIYSTEENAEAASKIYGGYAEEIEVDPDISKMNAGLRPWLVRMMRDGTVVEVIPWETTTWESGGFDFNRNLIVSMWAKDKEHAVKIANEKRTQMIAEWKWE